MQSVGGYTLIERLDRGEAVEVWSASRTAAGFERRCEVCLWRDPAAALAHAELLGALRDPGTPALVDYGEDRVEGYSYVCWEELSGKTVGALLAEGTEMGAPEALLIAHGALSALGALHALTPSGVSGEVGHGAVSMDALTVGAGGRIWLGGLSHVASRVASAREGRASMSPTSADTIGVGRMMLMLMRGAPPWPRAQTIAASMVSRASTHDALALARAVRDLIYSDARAAEEAREALASWGAERAAEEEDFDAFFEASGLANTPAPRSDGLYQTAELDAPLRREDVMARGPADETVNIKRDELDDLRAPARRTRHTVEMEAIDPDALIDEPEDHTAEFDASDWRKSKG